MTTLFTEAILSTATETEIYVTFKDGRFAKYTANMLPIFRQEDCVDYICDENGEVIFENN